MKWNKEQTEAINTRNKNILVSASAGSGKTTVLIARLMDLVMNDHVEIDQILAMTFTEAAASEMKKRLAASLQKALKECVDEDKRKYIKKQLSGISNAYISTIHSFCLTTLKKYYYIIGLEPERINNILDEATQELLQANALRQAFNKQYQKQDDSFLRLCEMFSARSEDDTNLKEAIRNLAEIANTQKDSVAWLNYLPSLYDQKNSISELDFNLQFYFFDYLKTQIEIYEQLALELEECVDEDDEKAYTPIQAKLQGIKQLLTVIDEKDYLLYQSTLKHTVSIKLATFKDKYLKDLREAIHSVENKLLAMAFDESVLLNDLYYLKAIVKKLAEITLDYKNYYDELKQYERVIDFNDMEHYTLEILKANNGQIANVYREQFVEIMVDEFQDSNEVQDELVRLITRGNNVFRVGDIKQSIYGFRYAKPDIMRNLIVNKTENDKVIYLSNNYRSKKMIVDFNNILFQKLMNIDGFHKGFSREDYANIGINSQLEDNHKIKFHAIHIDNEQKKALNMDSHDLKARFIAYQINKCLEEGYQLKDIAILTRSNGVQINIKKVLDEFNIPCFMDMKSGFFKTQSVQVMISALKAIDNPYDDIAFVAFLTSPLMQFNFEEIAQAKIKKKAKAKQLSIQQNAKVYEESYYEYFMNDERLLAFHELRNLRYRLSLSEMMNELYRFNDYYEYNVVKQERVNLDLLFDKAVDFEKRSALGIHAFVEQIAMIDDRRSGEATSIGKDEDVVRIMSIHKSKGLQFPIVILYSSTQISFMDSKSFVMYDELLGAGMDMITFPNRYRRATLIRKAIYHKKNQEALEEEMRILYVATTRAEKQMHIVDVIDGEYPPLSRASVYARKGYTSWILPMMEDNLDICEIKNYYGLPQAYALKVEKNDLKQLPRYTLPTKSIKLNSATAYKKKKSYTSLRKNDQGMVYGTMMHKMVELLQNESVDEKRIIQIANKEDYLLRESDIEKLLKLYQNDVFSDLIKKECYFELPYQVKKGEEIFSGYLDFMAVDKDCVYIVDFKSDSLTMKEAFITRYKQQLQTYAYAMKQIYPLKQIKTYIYAFHLHEMIEVGS